MFLRKRYAQYKAVFKLNLIYLMLDTPILFLVFNRPETTQKVFDKIRQIRPRQLFVAADGPRPDRPEEKDKTDAVRKIITENIDWDCDLQTLFRSENLGCGQAVSEGITWFFTQVEQGVILEDDTLPDLSFFNFCENLLNHYTNHQQVMLITGSNFQSVKSWGKGSYFFSRYPNIWGWASWRRAWQHYDYDLQSLDYFLANNQLDRIVQTEKEKNYWTAIFRSFQAEDSIDTWDYQWIYSIWNQKGLTIVPNKNLITNIGFGENATHTTGTYLEKVYKKKRYSIDVIKHPDTIKVYPRADLDTFKNFFNIEPKTAEKLKNSFKKVLKKIVG